MTYGITSDWQEGKLNTLRTLWAQSELSTAAIGRIMNITKNAVVGKAHRLGLEGRPSPIKLASGIEPPPRVHRIRQGVATLPAMASAVALVAAPVLERAPQPLPPPAPTAVIPQPAAAVVRRLAVPVRSKPCEWPTWKANERPTHLYCGAPTEGGRRWCPKHTALGTVKGTKEFA